MEEIPEFWTEASWSLSVKKIAEQQEKAEHMGEIMRQKRQDKHWKTNHVNTLRLPLAECGEPRGYGEAGDVVYLD